MFPGGCFFAQLLAEYDAPSGAIHDALAEGQRGWLGLLEGLIATAQECGELNPAIDAAQLAFELYAALELANYLFTLYRDSSMTDRGRRAIRTAIVRALRPAR